MEEPWIPKFKELIRGLWLEYKGKLSHSIVANSRASIYTEAAERKDLHKRLKTSHQLEEDVPALSEHSANFRVQSGRCLSAKPKFDSPTDSLYQQRAVSVADCWPHCPIALTTT